MVNAYVQRHDRLRKKRGSATLLKCVDCNNPAHQWSQLRNSDPDNFDNYSPRCHSCHRKYDFTEETRAKLVIHNRNKLLANPISKPGSQHPNSIFTEANVLEIRERYSTGNYSISELARIYDAGWSTINKIVKRINWRHI